MFPKIFNKSNRFVKITRQVNLFNFVAPGCNFATKTVKVPFMGDSITEGKLIEFSKTVGDFVNADEVVAVVETDKTSLEISSPESGVVEKFHQPLEAIVNVDSPLFDIDVDGKVPKDSSPPSAKSAPEPVSEPKDQQKTPTEPAPKKVSPPKAPKSAPNAASKGSGSSLRAERRIPLSWMRLRIAERLKESQNTAASLTTLNEIDCSELLNMKNSYKESFLKATGQKLGLMSPFVKASTLALRRFPEINSYFDAVGKQLVMHDFVDVSIAVAGPKGLVVPVLRNTELMTFADIEREIKGFVVKAKEEKIKLEEMQGGTFTLSNSGVYKSLIGTPIINPPQSAVLGIYGIFEKPVAIKGKVEIRPMMQVALTYDHRVVDGREAVLFLRAIKEYIEDPLTMVLL